ncbi:winged helix-turn-helix domain-containing protein [Phenylobacterium sp.]|uniref:winged helix-turn-helix domain-containing protein n=1 Tax=Phenylobacterium sp. TaxID=1871053 RepID=UPI0025F26586|nr:winged helix-turn-helix domain-containing protein [Phenylobacterium sp.]
MPTTRISLGQEPDRTLGGIQVNPARGLVSDGVTEQRVRPQVMQALLLLMDAEGRTVTRDELVDGCWDGRVVSDDAINRVIAQLRILARQFDPPPFTLETIPKIGFRLNAADSGKAGPAAPPPLLDKPPPDASSKAHPQLRAQGRRFLAWAAGVAGLLLLLVIAGAWVWFGPVPAAPDRMMVRLSGFRTLSADLPATLRESISAEIAAAFSVDGVVGVSTMSSPKPGTAYALDGAIYRVGDSIRVITRFTNQHTGVVLWSDSADYAADQVSKVPHKIAVDAGTVVRCGLSGAATYRKALPDTVLSNYMQYCQEYWSYGGSKTLHFAQRVVAAVPDFSWGWSAVANGYMQAADAERDSRRAEEMRAAGREAEDRAVALDRNNSEALAHKAYLIDPHDWIGQEKLFKSAIAAKPLDCGCEHYGYGLKLQSVGRLGAAIEQFHAATDMLALWPDSQLALGRALLGADRGEEARPYLDAAIDLSKDPNFDKRVAVAVGAETGDYAAAITALRSPRLQMPKESRAALLSGYQALASGAPQAKMQAIQGLLALPKDKQTETVAILLAALGANREALQVAAQRPRIFWRRSMRGVLTEPAFPALADQLGLMAYWRTSGTKPDACQTTSKPPFCRMI